MLLVENLDQQGALCIQVQPERVAGESQRGSVISVPSALSGIDQNESPVFDQAQARRSEPAGKVTGKSS